MHTKWKGDPHARPRDNGADVTFDITDPYPARYTLTVEWLDGEPALTGIHTTVPINFTVLDTFPLRALTRIAIDTAVAIHMPEDTWVDEPTGWTLDHIREILNTHRASSPHYLPAIAAICRWAKVTGQPRLDTLDRESGRTRKMTVGYLKRVKETFEETGDEALAIDAKFYGDDAWTPKHAGSRP